MIRTENIDISYDFIEKVEDLSDHMLCIQRRKIHFKNKFQLSIVFGRYSYGSREGLFEIAIFDKNRNMSDSYFDEEDKGDIVLGYCNQDKVRYYITKIGLL
ncbi:MAG: hypothetical protein ACTSYH_03705 [Candidatus Heimdallarchaeaceae archaeon]